MAEIRPTARVTCEATFVLNEIECRALDALIGYGIEPFLKVFYEKMGRTYMEPHEQGLRDLFAKFGKAVHPALEDVQAARQLLGQSFHTRRVGA